MQRAQKRDAVLNQYLHFRAHIGERGSTADDVRETSINEIVNGPKDPSDASSFPGLIPLIRKYLIESDVAKDICTRLDTYIDFVGRRASGECWTVARWIRTFVRNHPAYGEDSIVNDTITHDLAKAVRGMVEGKAVPFELFGKELAMKLMARAKTE